MPETINKPAKKKKAPKNTDIDKIMKQRRKNPLMTITDQAKLNGVSKQALSSLLKRHNIDVDTVEEYKAQRADLFAGKQEMVLRNIDERAVKRIIAKAPMAAVNLFGVLFDKERLERGASTQNIAVFMAQAVVDADKDF